MKTRDIIVHMIHVSEDKAKRLEKEIKSTPRFDPLTLKGKIKNSVRNEAAGERRIAKKLRNDLIDFI